MTKIAIYARYSTDLQSPSSIDDQFRICKTRAKFEGWDVAGCYSDAGISGSTMDRPGLKSLMRDANNGKIDIVVAEALDRVSRDQEHIASIYKLLTFDGIKLITLSEGEITTLQVGINGMLNTLYVEELARKTHRGLQGRALAGKSAGGKAYGYDVVRKLDSNGEPIRGERSINVDEASIIVRIHREYAKGKSPKNIAVELNKEGVAGPTGKGWACSTINGNRKRGTGILNNELYIGRQIWDRQRFVKNPHTGKRCAIMNPPEQWTITEIPELRILEQKDWDAVKSYQIALDREPQFNKKKRPPKLFSYLLKCGECGGGMSMVSRRRYGCSTSRNKGTCENRTTISQDKLEETVLNALRTRLMDAKLTKVFCDEYTAHINRMRMENNASLIQNRKRLEKTEKSISKLISAIKDGIDPLLIKDEINGLQRQKEELIDILDNTEEAPSYIHPKMADRYAKSVSNLISSLNEAEHRDESAKILRELIEKIVLTPNEDRSALIIDLFGDLAGILQMSEQSTQGIVIKPKEDLERSKSSEIEQVQQVIEPDPSLVIPYVQGNKVQMVAGVGFEPTTFRL